LRNSFLVALHGSGDPTIGTGYRLVQVSIDGNVTDFISGFLKDGTRYIRPAGILKKDNTSFFFSDDFSGILYLVTKQ
jgi:glucose/arabinose dehydrogenase